MCRYAGTQKTSESYITIIVIVTAVVDGGVYVARWQTSAHLLQRGAAGPTEPRIHRVAVPDQQPTISARRTAARQRTASENLVPEPASQAQEIRPSRGKTAQVSE